VQLRPADGGRLDVEEEDAGEKPDKAPAPAAQAEAPKADSVVKL
jgi:hypothetical protein